LDVGAVVRNVGHTQRWTSIGLHQLGHALGFGGKEGRIEEGGEKKKEEERATVRSSKKGMKKTNS
jgi:hypothetical protein